MQRLLSMGTLALLGGLAFLFLRDGGLDPARIQQGIQNAQQKLGGVANGQFGQQSA